MRIVDSSNNELFTSVTNMATFGQRFKGLLFRSSIGELDAFWFDRCSSVHMFGMVFPIDAIFLDSEYKITKLYKGLRPWRMAWSWHSHSVLEVSNGLCDRLNITVGQQLRIIEHD